MTIELMTSDNVVGIWVSASATAFWAGDSVLGGRTLYAEYDRYTGELLYLDVEGLEAARVPLALSDKLLDKLTADNPIRHYFKARFDR